MKQRRTDKEIVQERAMKTREKILVSALGLYSTKGYQKTTVDEIAASAGLSTGIAYRYFKNKRELLLQALEYVFTNIKNIAGVSERDLFGEDLDRALKVFENLHIRYYDFHEELESLRHSDEKVADLYDDFMVRAIDNIYEGLPESIKERPGSYEDLYIAIGLMENYCHTYMHGRLDEESLSVMRKKTLETVGRLIGGG